MGSSTQLTQQTGIILTNDIAPKFDADIHSNCVVSSDTSQTMTGINISNSVGTNISQKNRAQSYCKLQTALSYIDKMNLNEKVLQDAFAKAKADSGIIMPASTSVSQNTLTQISNNIHPATAIHIQLGCMQSSMAAQKIDGAVIANTSGVVLAQIDDVYNQCIQNVAAEVAAENHIDISTKQEVGAEASSQSWDPIASLGSLFGGIFGSLGASAMASVGLVVCLCCVCIAVIVFGLFMTGSFGKSGDADALAQQAAARMPFTGQGSGGGEVV